MKSADREVAIMTRGVIAWGHARWPGCRAICELAMGDRRIDVVFVLPNDLIGVEVKSSVDRLDRLEAQMIEYSRYVPEIWAAVAPRWRDQVDGMYRVHNKMVVTSEGHVETIGNYRARLGDGGRRPHRDELSIMRLIELLWRSEAATIAERTGVVPGARHTQMQNGKLYPMLARLLTGNQILREVCTELRARRLVGKGSDSPLRQAPEPAGAPRAARGLSP